MISRTNNMIYNLYKPGHEVARRRDSVTLFNFVVRVLVCKTS